MENFHDSNFIEYKKGTIKEHHHTEFTESLTVKEVWDESEDDDDEIWTESLNRNTQGNDARLTLWGEARKEEVKREWN